MAALAEMPVSITLGTMDPIRVGTLTITSFEDRNIRRDLGRSLIEVGQRMLHDAYEQMETENDDA